MAARQDHHRGNGGDGGKWSRMPLPPLHRPSEQRHLTGLRNVGHNATQHLGTNNDHETGSREGKIDNLTYKQPLQPGHAGKELHHQQHLPIGRASTDTTSTSDEGSGNRSNIDHLKVRLGGKSLDSISYSSLNRGDVHSNATRLLQRLKLGVSDENERESSTATTKVSNFTIQRKVQTRPLKNAMSTVYYRPVDNLAKGANEIIAPPPPSAPPHSDKPPIGSCRRGPADLSFDVEPLQSELSELSYNSFEYTKSYTPHYHGGAKRNDLRKITISNSNSESDDDSVRRMESVTHTFQRKDGVAANRNSKVSAVPLSGIGVDVRSDYNDDEEQCGRVRTPREAANASCSFSSFISEMLGVTPPRDGNSPKMSPFDMIVVSVASNP